MPRVRQASTITGQTSVSISTPMRGAKRSRKRPTAPGSSHGCQTCRSPGCSSLAPSSRPVAVPCVSRIGMSGCWRRSSAIRIAAARVSPSETACTQQPPVASVSAGSDA